MIKSLGSDGIDRFVWFTDWTVGSIDLIPV